MANPNNPLAPGLNGAAPKGPRTIWNNPVFSAVLAIIMGFAMWIIVTVYIDPQGSTTVTGVPINYTSGASTYTAQGLDIVEKPDIEGVTVKVEGNSTIIGNIRSADIMVYPSYAGVSGAGKVTLRLQARVTNTTDFPGDIECTVESPSTIDVVFDEVSEKTVSREKLDDALYAQRLYDIRVIEVCVRIDGDYIREICDGKNCRREQRSHYPVESLHADRPSFLKMLISSFYPMRN